MRADALRNRARILEAANEVIREHGAEASLEEIARRAGVGSATLHRHFPSRRELLDEIFRECTTNLCERALARAADAEPGAALRTWLHELCNLMLVRRGLAASLLGGRGEADSCYAKVGEAGGILLCQAVNAGEVRPEVSIVDLLTLVNGIALATEDRPDEAGRLLALALTGIS
ncbi:AcrR family transcriptional regulator [Crossiella equi]|uniref:AcrR family transcriptional regulator n=1 Tax=Crossiella equi TaxID=130796 RepID=A0ABS5AR24_9PSEU|nr:TetR/AcrR family transcriptional regulator [Crossiella equi]MBP2478896.1 AcrR family transcriptional regulator [Crossiella equi]